MGFENDRQEKRTQNDWRGIDFGVLWDCDKPGLTIATGYCGQANVMIIKNTRAGQLGASGKPVPDFRIVLMPQDDFKDEQGENKF